MLRKLIEENGKIEEKNLLSPSKERTEYLSVFYNNGHSVFSFSLCIQRITNVNENTVVIQNTMIPYDIVCLCRKYSLEVLRENAFSADATY